MIKVLNLYSGIGGNRKLWDSVRNDLEITAVENNEKIAKIYQDFFPNDKVVIDDAHDYLLKHFKEFDFIWSSPPCPSHSRIRKCFVGKDNKGQNKPIYPDMKLYEEILFLQHYFNKGKFVVENVRSFYEPLIEPQEIALHYFWTNFYINPYKVESREHYSPLEVLAKLKGVEIKELEGVDKRVVLRNCVEPQLGLHIFQEAFKEYKTLTKERGSNVGSLYPHLDEIDEKRKKRFENNEKNDKDEDEDKDIEDIDDRLDKDMAH